MMAPGRLDQRMLERLGWVGSALLVVAGVALLEVARRQLLPPRRRMGRRQLRDYARRSGLPRPAREMRGAAKDFRVPEDFRIPQALRPWV